MFPRLTTVLPQLADRGILVYSSFKDMEEIHKAPTRAWQKSLASLLPLWPVSISIWVEGFPPPTIPIEIAVASFALAIFDSIELLWKRWITVELILYSFLPLAFLFVFNEISTTYHFPLTVLCTLILSAGIIGYQSRRSAWSGRLILFSAATVTLVMASNAARSFWDMVADSGYKECFPDAQGCPLLTGQGHLDWFSSSASKTQVNSGRVHLPNIT